MLSYLPFIDTFLYQGNVLGSFSTFFGAKSFLEFRSLLWNASPVPFSADLRLLLNLLPSVIESNYMASSAIMIRMALNIVVYLSSFSVRDLVKPLGVVGAMIFSGFVFHKAKLNRLNEKVFRWLLGILCLTLLYYGPIQTLFFCFLFYVEFLWLSLLGNLRNKRLADIRLEFSRVLLVLSVPIVLSNCF